MKLGHVPKSAVVGEDLAVAALVEVDAAVALKQLYSAIENFESLLPPVRHVHKFVWVKALSKSDVIPARLQK